MADRYWVGGTGSWQDTTKWSNISGGTGGFSVPVSPDNVYIDNNSHLNTAFNIVISATSVSIGKFEVQTLSYSLLFRSPLNKDLTVLDRFYCANTSTLFNFDFNVIFLDPSVPENTTTYNSVSKLLGSLEVLNCKLKSDLYVSASASGYGYVSLKGDFNSNSKNIYINGEFEFIPNATLGGVQTFSNSFLYLNGDYSTYFYHGGPSNFSVFDNTTIEINNNRRPIYIYSSSEEDWVLPNFVISSTSVHSFSIFIESYANGFMDKFSFTKTGNLDTSRVISFDFTPDFRLASDYSPVLTINKLSISASAQNRVLFGTKGFLYTLAAFYGQQGKPLTLLNINSASLSQVIFQNVKVVGFRGESSVSFSASNISYAKIGVDKNFDPFIKIAPPRTVYWNNSAGGNLYSNSFTSATGGTVTTTWIPFPQDLIKIVDTGLNSSATLSFPRNNNVTSIFPGIDASERTLPFSFNVSNSNSAIILGKFITNDKAFFVGKGIRPLVFEGSGTFNVVNRISCPTDFGHLSTYKITSKLDCDIIQARSKSNLDFNNYTLSASVVWFNPLVNISNIPSRIYINRQLASAINLPNTEIIVRPLVASSNNYIQGNRNFVPQEPLKLDKIILEGESFSYSIRFGSSLIVNDLIYNKTGNIAIGLFASFNYVVKHLKLMGLPNGTTTASIRFSSTSTSLTAVITYAGVDVAESLSFVDFTRVAIEPQRTGQNTYRVFAGARSSTTPANNGAQFTDKPRITNVNDGSDVTSNSVIKINTNVTAGFAPVFSVKYDEVAITDLSLNNSTTYVATFPNYFANNIKVGAKHELKIIKGN